MDEGAEWVLRQVTVRVFQHNSESHIPDIAWKRQCKTLFGVVESRVQERFIRRIAAHDAVERDKGCRRQLGRNRYKVGMDKTHRVRAAETCCLLACDAVVRRRRIDRDRMGDTPLEEAKRERRFRIRYRAAFRSGFLHARGCAGASAS
jgi:hypothetical protein